MFLISAYFLYFSLLLILWFNVYFTLLIGMYFFYSVIIFFLFHGSAAHYLSFTFLLSFSIRNSLLLLFFSRNLCHQFICIYFNNARYHCPCPCIFSIKRPLQLSIARNQTKVNVVKFSRNLFFFPTNTNRSRFRPFFLQLLTTVNRSISHLFNS